jgi:hypothetical protein
MNKSFALAGILVASLCTISVAQADDCSPDSKKTSDAKSSACTTGQDLAPIKQIGMYLDGYHTYRKEKDVTGEKQRQIRTAHYCKQINPDMFQCLIYDGNGANAKCIGVEYVITDALFKTLPAEEQKLWHAHDTEVDTGLLVLPGMPKDKEKEILTVLRSTHGKTWQVWPDLSSKVPMGEPELMWNVDPDKIGSATKKSASARATDPTF